LYKVISSENKSEVILESEIIFLIQTLAKEIKMRLNDKKISFSIFLKTKKDTKRIIIEK